METALSTLALKQRETDGVQPHQDASLQAPLSPPWDAAIGLVTVRNKCDSCRVVGRHFQDEKHQQSLLQTFTERLSKEDTATAVPYSSHVLSYPFS